ncbi:succinate dehydrogenase, cytochrome b556 subunit [Mycoplana ramosa]|uniref:Succinate dehydrogenase cytochrome b556 subunit n=1 Tax=Mycoplana ramosa TaxID=40837 RepID=A0ABW3YVG8_MYCRA
MTNVTKSRPLSPHLQIYKPIPTMVMSIMHRITGGALYVGTVLVAWWLIAAAMGESYFDWVSWFFGTWIGRLVLFGYTWALFHHMLGGIRHLVWDTGRGYEKHFSTKVAKAMPVASVALAVLTWIIGYLVR